MIIELGIISGEILMFMDKQNVPVPMREIYSNFNYSKEDFYMAVGWLTREGMIHIEQDMNSQEYMVSLITKQS